MLPSALAGGYEIRVDDGTSQTSDFRSLLATSSRISRCRGLNLSALFGGHENGCRRATALRRNCFK